MLLDSLEYYATNDREQHSTRSITLAFPKTANSMGQRRCNDAHLVRKGHIFHEVGGRILYVARRTNIQLARDLKSIHCCHFGGGRRILALGVEGVKGTKLSES